MGCGLLDVSNAPIATELCLAANFRDVPNSGRNLFDDLVGAGEYRRGNGYAQRLRGLQVENH